MFLHPHRWSFPRTPRGERGLVPDRSRPALARTVARASVRAISRWAPSLLDRAGRYAPCHACGGPSRPRKAIRRAPTSGRTRCARHRPRRHINHRRRPRRAIRQRDIARRLLSASTGRLKRPRRRAIAATDAAGATTLAAIPEQLAPVSPDIARNRSVRRRAVAPWIVVRAAVTLRDPREAIREQVEERANVRRRADQPDRPGVGGSTQGKRLPSALTATGV
jgi:hypothetical protein